MPNSALRVAAVSGVATMALAGAATSALASGAPKTSGKPKTCSGSVSAGNPLYSTNGYTVVAAAGSEPTASALSCTHAKAVLAAGFLAVRKKGNFVPGLSFSLAGVSYKLEAGLVGAPGANTWVGDGIVVGFVHPVGQ